MPIVKTSSFEKNNSIFLKNDLNCNVQQKYGFKSALSSTIGYFISSVQNKRDSINEMVCRKKIIRSCHSAIEAIELKSANNDISEKSLRKIERKITKMNKDYSFLDTLGIKEMIKFKTRSANKPVQDKISAMLDRKFGIDVYHSKENLNAKIK